jgi:hypothetical protein
LYGGCPRILDQTRLATNWRMVGLRAREAATMGARTTESSIDGRGSLFVLLCMIHKMSGAVPEIEVAKQRWRDFKDRMEATAQAASRGRGRRTVLPSDGFSSFAKLTTKVVNEIGRKWLVGTTRP